MNRRDLIKRIIALPAAVPVAKEVLSEPDIWEGSNRLYEDIYRCLPEPEYVPLEEAESYWCSPEPKPDQGGPIFLKCSWSDEETPLL